MHSGVIITVRVFEIISFVFVFEIKADIVIDEVLQFDFFFARALNGVFVTAPVDIGLLDAGGLGLGAQQVVRLPGPERAVANDGEVPGGVDVCERGDEMGEPFFLDKPANEEESVWAFIR